MHNNKGFTLIEVMVAMVILFIGIIAASSMQLNAIKANHSSSYRSSATRLALSFLEELKRLDFDDASSYLGTNPNATSLDDGKTEASTGQALPNTVDHQFSPGDFPTFASSYQLVGSTLVDDKGRPFTIFWNVDYEYSSIIASSTAPAYCTIRLFIYWDGPFGRNHLEFTTIKYNNVKV